jgi:hypothetical protein
MASLSSIPEMAQWPKAHAAAKNPLNPVVFFDITIGGARHVLCTYESSDIFS